MYAQDNNSLPVWIILSPAHHHISIKSQPFLVGIVSHGAESICRHSERTSIDRFSTTSLLGQVLGGSADGEGVGGQHEHTFPPWIRELSG